MAYSSEMSIFSVSLSLWSQTLSVTELTAFAGVQPSEFHEKGELRSPGRQDGRVHTESMWDLQSTARHDTWTMEPHWATIAPVLESLASQDGGDFQKRLSIGTNARSLGYAFDLYPEQIELLARARCGVWIDTYNGNWDRDDLPPDYPFAGREPSRLRLARSRASAWLRTANPLSKARHHRSKVR